MANDQSERDVLAHAHGKTLLHANHYDWDLDGYLLDGRDITVVDCGNVISDPSNLHYDMAERAARLTFKGALC